MAANQRPKTVEQQVAFVNRKAEQTEALLGRCLTEVCAFQERSVH